MADSLLEQLKATVGQELVFQAPDEIGRSAFRQYALAVGDFNPLYSDREQATAHGLRDVTAPPTLVCDTWQYVDSDMDERGDLLGRGAFGKLTGLRAGNEYEFFQPIHPNDVLTAHWLVRDVYERTGRSGTLIFQVVEATYRNQRGDLLARNTETLFYREEPVLPGRDGGDGGCGGAVGGAAMNCSGHAGRFYEDVSVGDELTPLQKAIDLPRMIAYGAATWDFIRVHYDADHVRELGFSGPFVDGQMLGAFLAQHVQDWAGPGAFLRKLGFRNRIMVYPGDALVCRGVVTGLRREGDHDEGPGLVECDLWIENQRAERVVDRASALVQLPLRSRTG